MLTWRRAAPCLAALAVFPFLVPAVVGQMALGVSLLSASYVCIRGARQLPHVRGMFHCCAIAYALFVVVGADVVWHGKGTYLSFVTTITSALLFFVATVFLSYARRPHETREGIVDGFAALAGMVVIQWQWSALQEGATLYSIASGTAPVIAALLLATLTLIHIGGALDVPQQRLLLVPVNLAGVFVAVGIIVTDTFSRWDHGSAAVGCFLMAGYLLTGYWGSPGLRDVVAPAPERRRVVSMRWVGPACALATTPLMILLFVARGAVPTLGVGLACTAMTAMALWRVTRLSRQQERSRRELLAEQRFRGLVEHAADVVVIAEADTRISYANGGLEQLLGVAGSEIRQAPVESLFQPSGAVRLLEAMSRLVEEGDSAYLGEDVLLRTANGEQRWVAVHLTNRLASSAIRGWVLNIHDVTDRKRAEESLALLAHYDQLTGLPNRPALGRRLDEVVSVRPGGTALLFCDLDGFKAVNDGLGHDSGDELLRAVAGRWSALVRGGDILGRWGGDEFLMICPDVSTAEAAEGLAARLAAALAEPFALQTGSATVGVSIGAVVHRCGESPSGLIARADAAMYEAKRDRVGVHVA